MGPSSNVDSTKCLEWKDIMGDPFPRCMPLGGQSSWAATKSPHEMSDVTLVTSGHLMLLHALYVADILTFKALDATSMFHDVVPGANEPTTSVVAILAAADALQNASLSTTVMRFLAFGSVQSSNQTEFVPSQLGIPSIHNLSSTVVYALFQAETWGNIGSHKFVYGTPIAKTYTNLFRGRLLIRRYSKF